jgi:hypothetical protein
LSARLLTFKLLVNFFWLVITASVNFHSIVNGIGFHNFGKHKLEGRFEQIPTHIWWGLWLRLLRLVFPAFMSVPRGSHWYQKSAPLPAPSTLFEIHQF